MKKNNIKEPEVVIDIQFAIRALLEAKFGLDVTPEQITTINQLILRPKSSMFTENEIRLLFEKAKKSNPEEDCQYLAKICEKQGISKTISGSEIILIADILEKKVELTPETELLVRGSNKTMIALAICYGKARYVMEQSIIEDHNFEKNKIILEEALVKNRDDYFCNLNMISRENIIEEHKYIETLLESNQKHTDEVQKIFAVTYYDNYQEALAKVLNYLKYPPKNCKENYEGFGKPRRS